MTTTFRVTVPPWALADGMPPPEKGETFENYWTRMGIDSDVIDRMLVGLTERNACCANERMSTYLANRMPDAFSRYVDALHERWARR
jgi:hypothetical protein